MGIHVQIINNGKKISLLEAIKNGMIKITDNKLQAADGTTLSLSSKLFDCNGNELFENDIVVARGGKQYKIIYDIGMFYLSELKTNSIIPLCIYKAGNKIDVEKIII